MSTWHRKCTFTIRLNRHPAAHEKGNMVVQAPLEKIFERPARHRPLVLWSTAMHLLNLVYSLNWEDDTRMGEELKGAQSRLRRTLEEVELWLENV